MARVLYSDTTADTSLLVAQIKQGELALPDIQRPFVWGAAKVRELLDSMYRGYPVGHLLFWNTGAESQVRNIGVESKAASAPHKLIVDGQQRLTSLFAVMTGTQVLTHDYRPTRIKIAFRPADATFAVSDAAIEKDPEFISDISTLWNPEIGPKKTFRTYLRRLNAHRSINEDEADTREGALDGVVDLQHYPFKIVELHSDIDEEKVAEVFVRINSKGESLKQADFILTMMSVWSDKGRRELEDFSRAAKSPSGSAGPFNHHIQPSPAEMLRVAVALGFRRAVLKNVYSILRGRDMETGQVDPARRQVQFERLADAQAKALDLTNWHEFLQCLEKAGFRSAKMITANNAILFCYALWLIGRVDFGVPIDRLSRTIARWFFMAHTTSRYSGSFESRFESDVARVANVDPKDAEGFCARLDRVVDDTLTTDFWQIAFPDAIATSAAKSPSLMAYIAALNILDADSLLSTGSVRSRLEPAVVGVKGIERHHLFPKAHLKRIGITDTKQVNQIANMALVEWSDNIKISDRAPVDYWPEQLKEKSLAQDRLERQLRHHALPADWYTMEYDTFLETRRRLISEVVRKAYQQLGS